MTQIVRKGDPESAERAAELFNEANEAYDRGEYLLAIDLLDDAISNGLSNVVALNNKGAALDALERREAAAECYRSALAQSPEYELAWHNLGNCLFAQERYGPAARAYSKAARFNPDRTENLIGLAESLIEAGRFRKARAVIERLTAAAVKDKSLLLIQSDLYIRSRDGVSAIECCERYISASPDDTLGHAHLGGIRHELGDYKKAIKSLRRAVELSPDDPQIWNNYGYSCFCDGRIERALAAFDRAIAVNPSYKHAWYNKGYSLHGVDRLEEAVRCYERALEIDSSDPILLNNLGNALYNLGRYADSLPSFVEAIDVDPDYEIAWNNIGNALEKMGRYEDAIPFHDRSLEIRPDFDYAIYAKGVCKAAIGEVEEGYELVLESLDLNPSYDEAWRARSLIALQLGRTDDALASIENALALNPTLCDGWVERGDILARMGDGSGAHISYDRALACAEEMVSKLPMDGDPWRMKASVLFRLGRHMEALDSAVRAVTSRHPDMDALPLAFEICRVAGISELPQELVHVADGQKEPDRVLPYAAFMASQGDWSCVSERLFAIPFGELTQKGRLMLAKAIAATQDRQKALDFASRCPADERDKLVAEVEAMVGNLEAATERYRLILDRTPGDHAVALGLANALLSLNRFEEAVEAARIAAGIDAADWEPHEIMANAFESLGDSKRANEAGSWAKELKGRCLARPSVKSSGGMRGWLD